MKKYVTYPICGSSEEYLEDHQRVVNPLHSPHGINVRIAGRMVTAEQETMDAITDMNGRVVSPAENHVRYSTAGGPSLNVVGSLVNPQVEDEVIPGSEECFTPEELLLIVSYHISQTAKRNASTDRVLTSLRNAVHELHLLHRDRVAGKDK